MMHPVVWFELNGDDAKKLHGFYGELFGWKIDASNPVGYGMVEAEKGRGIAGGIGQTGTAAVTPGVTFYVSTPSIDDSLAGAKKLGGKVLMERTQIPSGPILAFFEDPQGNAVGLIEEEA